MPRDRLAELQNFQMGEFKNKQRDEDDSEVKLFLGAENDPIVRLQTEVDAIRRDLEEMEANLKVLKQKQANYAFKDSKNELSELSDTVIATSRIVRRKLKLLGSEVEKNEKERDPSKEARIRKIQHVTLTKQFTDLMTEYLETQEAYKEKCKDHVIRRIKIVNSNYTDEDIEKMLEEDNPVIFTGNLLAEQTRAKQNLDEAKAINTQMKKIEQSIIEIHTMFQDLATLVQEQGESLTRIEDFVHETAVRTEKSAKELQNALQKKTSARKMKIIIIVIVLVVIGIVVGVLVGVNSK